MIQESKIVLYKALDNIHPGSGKRGYGCDLSLQRDIISNVPKIYSTVLKAGIIENNKNKSSDISVSDGRLLFYPISGIKNLYYNVTSIDILVRFFEDIDFHIEFNGVKCKHIKSKLTKILKRISDYELSMGRYLSKDKIKNYINLDGHSFFKKQNLELGRLISNFINNILNLKLDNIIILSQNDFVGLVNFSTHKINRINIKSKDNKENGDLFSQEFISSKALFYNGIFLKKKTKIL